MSKQVLTKEEPIRICNKIRKFANRKDRRASNRKLRLIAKGK